MEYEVTIGLEIHAELQTSTKMFCTSRNDPDELTPNVNICPICLAHPGTLPVINREAVTHVLRVGAALGSTIADYTEFDRKNYFYPDLPKGYQISQFEFPLVSGGSLAGVPITRVHLEEDTASSIHDDASGTTLIDYNRSGVPLMELVTEPAIKSAAEAASFGRELQVLLRYLGASEANMEKGQMRVEANVSVAPKGERSTAYVEIKNLNSFKAMERAVLYEVERQKKLLDEGGVLVKQTLGWDENKQATFPQRSKEGAVDYRYFPDPDLPSLKISEVPEYSFDALKATLPELPKDRLSRYTAMGIKNEDGEFYVRETAFGDFLDKIAGIDNRPEILKLASNYIINDLVKTVRDLQTRESGNKDIISISANNFTKIIIMLSEKKISSRMGKDLLIQSVKENRDPEEIAKELDLFQNTSTDDLTAVIKRVIDQNQKVVADYKDGRDAALQFLIGQSMKALRGAADPESLKTLIIDKIKELG